MEPIRVIPCLDVAGGRVVKGVKFVDLVDAGDPVAIARAYDAAGADELCFLDINATREGRATTLDLVRRTAQQLRIPLTVGGGVRAPEDIAALLRAGAARVSIGSAAVADRELIARAVEQFGSAALVVAIDARATAPGRWEVVTRGGSEQSGLAAVEFARHVAGQGAGQILLTSMDRDGTRDGFDLALTRAVADAAGIPVIASGGAGTLQHMVAAVTEGGAAAVLAASVFHFGTFSIGEVRQALAAAGLPLRTVAGTSDAGNGKGAA